MVLQRVDDVLDPDVKQSSDTPSKGPLSMAELIELRARIVSVLERATGELDAVIESTSPAGQRQDPAFSESMTDRRELHDGQHFVDRNTDHAELQFQQRLEAIKQRLRVKADHNAHSEGMATGDASVSSIPENPDLESQDGTL